MRNFKVVKFKRPYRTKEGQRAVGRLNNVIVYEPLYIIDGKIVTEEEGFKSNTTEDWVLTMGDNLNHFESIRYALWSTYVYKYLEDGKYEINFKY